MKKRFLVLLAVALALISVFGVVALAQGNNAPADGCYVHGDINGDGVVDQQDAVYTLFHSFPLFQEEYPVEQNADFNKDGLVDGSDALHLMHAAAGEEGYELKGEIHLFSEPVWTWEVEDGEVSVTAVSVCPCGDKLEFTESTGITVTEGTMAEAGCVTPGSEEYVARVTVGGVLYSDIWTNEIPALGGHEFQVESCDQETKCLRCEEMLPAGSHNWVLSTDANLTYDATCTAEGNDHYTCSGCAQTQDIALPMVLHTYEFLEVRNQSGCLYYNVYKCVDCGQELEGTAEQDQFYKHEYTAALTQEPNCTHAGIKTFTCTCGDSYTEEVEPNGTHVWDAGVSADGTITYTCTVGCGQTKVVAAVQSGAAVTTDNLAGDGVEIQSTDADISGASLSLDDAAIGGLDAQQTITVSVEKANVDAMGLTEEQKAQIAGVVYDFTLTNGGENVARFDGQVTISLPYTLQEGDDVDCIDVWFIAEDGTLTVQQGTYSNGFVTFTTDHFSYYTVTRLTPAERCAVYGHSVVTTIAAASCHQEGFTMNACQRCGESHKTDVVPKTQHDFQPTGNGYEATCTQSGYEEFQCSICMELRSKVIPAKGHDFHKDEEASVAATCGAAGKNVMVCGCGEVKETVIGQLIHQYVKTESQTVSCETRGFDRYVCQLCQGEQLRNVQAATGHKWVMSDEEWVWNDDHTKATLTLVCEHDAEHTKTLNGVITKKTETSVCLGGAITYTATASFNKQVYTSTVTVNVEAPGHVPAAVWNCDAEGHSRECMVCKEIMDEGKHTFSEAVTKAPTCTANGILTKTCDSCGYSTNALIEATGIHSFVGGVCSECGVKESGCDHALTELVTLNLADYGACDGEVILFTCPCGSNTELMNVHTGCNWDDENAKHEESGTGLSYRIYTSRTCKDCGLTSTEGQFVREAGNCIHDVVVTSELSMNGVRIAATEEVVHTYYHSGTKVARTYDLADYGACGGTLEYRVCECGEGHDWYFTALDCEEMLYDPETGVQYCALCGLSYETDATSEETDDCIVRYGYTFTLKMKGEPVLTLDCLSIYESHLYTLESYRLLGDSCTDGLIYSNRCTGCGESYTYTTASHAQLLKEYVDLTSYDGCAQKLVITSCPCEEKYTGYEFMHNQGKYHQWGYDVYNDTACHGVCGECGWEITGSATNGEKDANCMRQQHWNYVLSDGKGNSWKLTSDNMFADHDYEVEFDVHGSSCTDGVTVTETCKDCGAVSGGESTYHNPYVIETIELPGTCAEAVDIYSCGCGYFYGYQYTSGNSCDMDYVQTDNGYVFQCRNCGLRESTGRQLLANIDSCSARYRQTYKFHVYDDLVATYQFDHIQSNHRTVAEITHVSGEDSCLQGWYKVKQVCTVCDKVVNQELYGGFGSTIWFAPTARSSARVSSAMTWSWLPTAASAVRAPIPSWNAWVTAASWNGPVSRMVTPCSIAPSAVCWRRPNIPPRRWRARPARPPIPPTMSSPRTVRRWWQWIPCRSSPPISTSIPFTETAGESDVTVDHVCRKCRYGGTERYGWWEHYDLPVAYVDIGAAGGCETVFVQYACPCGEVNYSHSTTENCRFTYGFDEYDDDQGVHHFLEYATCELCNVVRTRDYVNAKAEGCTKVQEGTVTYAFGDEVFATLPFKQTSVSHNIRALSAVLVEGAKSCQDGVRISYACTECGEHLGTGIDYYHVTMVDSTKDLAEFGAECGAHMVHSRCACGEVDDWDLAEDIQCDIVMEQAMPFEVDGEVFTGYYEYAIGGPREFYEYYFNYYCSVTEPACDLKIRKASVWLVEGCELVQYNIWQLGVDEATGTCMETLKIPTGSYYGFHDFDTTFTSQEENGRTITTESGECARCGSTFQEKVTYEGAYMIQEETILVNKADNHDPAKTEHVVDYTIFQREDGGYESFYYRALTTKTAADGQVTWFQDTRSFSGDIPCYGVNITTNSEGDYYEYGFENHVCTHNGEFVRYPTCTQTGILQEMESCSFCEYEYVNSSSTTSPYGHNFGYNGQLYICENCGLESRNGSSGSLVLEDLTTDPATTVIGYWNKSGEAFTPYLSVVLGDTDEELVLDVQINRYNELTDTIRGIYWSTAEAQAAAEAALAQRGYTGEYALRISLVPQGGSDLDYAITFDTQVAE